MKDYPRDFPIPVVAAGPGFKRGLMSDVPAGNVDIAPTLAYLLGLEGETFDGRVLREALADGPDPASVTVERDTLVAETDGLRQSVQFSMVAGARYVDFGSVERG